MTELPLKVSYKEITQINVTLQRKTKRTLRNTCLKLYDFAHFLGLALHFNLSCFYQKLLNQPSHFMKELTFEHLCQLFLQGLEL